jgi:predicted DNA-binding transcriptional regulator AlpA
LLFELINEHSFVAINTAKMAMLVQLSEEDLAHLIQAAVRLELERALGSRRSQNPEPQEQLLNLNEVMQLLRVSRVTIFNWIRQKKIPVHRMSKKLFFKKSEILKAMLTNIDKKK